MLLGVRFIVMAMPVSAAVGPRLRAGTARRARRRTAAPSCSSMSRSTGVALDFQCSSSPIADRHVRGCPGGRRPAPASIRRSAAPQWTASAAAIDRESRDHRSPRAGRHRRARSRAEGTSPASCRSSSRTSSRLRLREARTAASASCSPVADPSPAAPLRSAPLLTCLE